MWRILIMLVFATNSMAELPPAPTFRGEIKRSEQGLVVTPGKPANDIDQAQVNLPEQQHVSVERPQTSKLPDSVKGGPITQTAITNQGAIDSTSPKCAIGAITCIEVNSTSDRFQASVPITFGQPFKAGDLANGSRLAARDKSGGLQIQMDEESSHRDGSTRFAVLSSQISNLEPGERRVINLYKDTTSAIQIAAPEPNPTAFDIKLVATMYSPQITQINFGNRDGRTPGIPFEVGEEVTLQLGDTADEHFSHRVTTEQAGGAFPNLTKLAEVFRDLINSRSKRFKAYKIGEGGGYEKLWVTTKRTEDQAFQIKFIYSGKARIGSVQLQKFTAPQHFVASGRLALEQALHSRAKPRLQGPVAREYALVAPFIESVSGKKHPQLTARLHTRFFENNQRIRSDVILENNWAYEPDPGNLTYELKIQLGNKVVLHQPPFTHYHHSRWHKVLWIFGEAPQVSIRHNMPYFIASKATWNYDLSLNIPEQVLVDEQSRLGKANTRPMGAAFITESFGTTGGREEIGPLPRWTALYLLTQDTRAKKSMLANADAAASIPIHYRDFSTDLPLSLHHHPGMSISAERSEAKDRQPAMKNADTPWKPDISHQGSFAYIPYLISGDLFYQEESLFWATFNMFFIYPQYRGGTKGLINAEQIRGQAWALRSLGEASRVLPDKHPMKKYFQNRLEENLKWYADHYSTPEKSGVSPLGCIVAGDNSNETAPWQDDFMTIVVAQQLDNQEPQAAKYLQSIARCSTDRWTQEDKGFCRYKSPAYWINIRRDNGAFMSSWPEVFRANWPEIKVCNPAKPMDGYPGSASGYVAYARAALAVASDFDIPGAAGAYRWLSAQTPSIQNSYAHDPTWAIVPRNSDQAIRNSQRH